MPPHPECLSDYLSKSALKNVLRVSEIIIVTKDAWRSSDSGAKSDSSVELPGSGY